MSRVFRFGLTVVLLGLAALVPRASGASAQTLSPPPPPGAICQTTGDGSVCRFSNYFFVTGGPDAGNLFLPISVFLNQPFLFEDCGSFQIYLTYTGGSVDGSAYYDQAGHVTLVREVSNFPGVLTTSGRIGGDTTVAYTENYVHTNRIQNGTITQTFDGLSLGRVEVPGQGSILFGAGTVAFSISADGTFTFIHGSGSAVTGNGPYRDDLCTALAPA